MSNPFFLGSAVLLLASFVVAGCGGDDSSDTTSSTSSTTGGGDTFPASNGCDPATAEDHTADATDVTVTFGGAVGNAYSPACITINAGQNVAFKGSFTGHFLTGGTATDSTLTPETASPIGKTTSGTEAVIAFPAAGTFPYYCEQHGKLGMKGAVFVK